MPPVRLTIRQGPFHTMTRAPDGAVGRHILGKLRAVEVEAKRRCPVDEGELRGSSKIDMRIGSRGPEGTVTFSATHAVFVHEGTKPHWPPFDAVAKWAQRHGFPGPYLVAKAIALKGTKGTPYLYDGLVAVITRARRRHPG